MGKKKLLQVYPGIFSCLASPLTAIGGHLLQASVHMQRLRLTSIAASVLTGWEAAKEAIVVPWNAVVR